MVTTAGYRREGRVLLEFGAVGEGRPGRFKHPKPRAQLLLARNRGINTPSSLSPPQGGFLHSGLSKWVGGVMFT